ncbi:MAG: hypothetical protein IJ306_02775 [Oscillospiraceae bacterium]|nr:hypothetical protein [Oscillospiraceae bacterium]
MKPRTKKITLTIVTALLICVTAVICISIYKNIKFREEFALSSSITVIENGEVTTVDFATGKIKKSEMDIEKLDLGEETVFANGGDIYSKENGEWVKILSTEYEIEGKPIISDDMVYFIAPEPESEGGRYLLFYIWKAKNGIIEKYHEKPVDVSGLLLYDDKIIFVEKSEFSDHFTVREKSIVDGKETLLTAGYEISWYEHGKSFFYINKKGGKLCVYNLEADEQKTIDYDIDYYRCINYNCDENVILLAKDRPGWQWDYCEPINAIYYMDSGELIYFDTYFSKICLNKKENLWFTDFSAWYWN